MSNSQIDDYGTTRWFNSDGILHREDGPAIEHADGNQYWLVNGILHRDEFEGPAAIHANFRKEWFLRGILHRTSGPAVEYDNGDAEWWIDNSRLTSIKFSKFLSER